MGISHIYGILGTCLSRMDAKFCHKIIQSVISENFRGIAYLLPFLSFAKYLEQKNFISNSLKFIGKRTFDIYLIHYFFIPDLSGIWRYIGESDMLLFQLMVSMFLMITTVFCSILLGEIVRRSGRVAKWILGVY